MQQRVALAPVAEASKLASEIGLPEWMGNLNAFRMLANNPGLARGVFAQHAALRFTNRLPVRLRELMIMRIAWRTGSAYEWAAHWRVATQAGIGSEDIVGVRDWQAHAPYSAADRAALAAVDDTLSRGRISDEVWRLCTEHVGGPAELVEMVVAIGHWNSFSQLLQSLAVPLEEGTPPWQPDGVAPA